VVVIQELAAEFQIELVVEISKALQNFRRLFGDVLFIIKTAFIQVHGEAGYLFSMN
jgi:hypothetical protein